MAMKTMKLIFEREGEEVAVVINSSCVDRLRNLVSPYIRVREVEHIPESIWTIFTEAKYVINIESFELYKKSSLGEPDNCMLLNLSNKQIIIDQSMTSWRIMYTFRMIRNLLRWGLYTRGYIYLHGGLIDTKGKGIAFMGKKKSGKTSSILAILASKDVNYITNDDLTIKISTNGVRAFGWPRTIGVRYETLIALETVAPQYIHAMGKLTHPNNINIDNKNEKASPNCVFFSPIELANACGTTVACETNLEYIIFPRFLADNNKKAYVERLDPKAALNLLVENVEKLPDKHSDFLIDYFDLPKEGFIRKNLQYLADNVPIYLLYQKFDRLLDGSSAALSIVDNNYNI